MGYARADLPGAGYEQYGEVYTRLFPIGSSRNIDAEKYGSPRLMLPGKKKYVEVGVDEYGIYDHYEQAAFSGIYPRRMGTVSSVRSEEVKDEEGKTFTVYYFKDGELDFDPNDYELAGETKRVSFQSGDLSGLGEGDDHYFEVNFDSATREFEIITICLMATTRSFQAASSFRRQGIPISFGTSGCQMNITLWQRRNSGKPSMTIIRNIGWTSPLTRLRPITYGSRSRESICLSAGVCAWRVPSISPRTATAGAALRRSPVR